MMCPPLLAAGLMHRIASMPVTYWLLWCGSFVLTIGVLVLLRARWGQSRPLQKCSLLSLLVHLLLGCIAMTIRVVAGDGGGGVGTPIRVRIVNESSVSTPNFANDVAPEMAPPKLLEQPQPETSPEFAEAEPKVDETVDAPPLLEAPAEVPDAEMAK